MAPKSPQPGPEGNAGADGQQPTVLRRRAVRRGWYGLLVLPFVATLIPPIYAREAPSAGPWPFFFWWLFAWVVVTAFIVAFVYRVTTVTVREPVDRPPGHGDRSDRDGQAGEEGEH